MRNWMVATALFALVLASAAHAEVYTCQSGDNMWNWISKQPPKGLGLYDSNDTSNMWKAVWAIQAINNQVAKSGDVTPIVDENVVNTGEKYWLPSADLVRQVISEAEANASGTGSQAFKDAARTAATAHNEDAQCQYASEASGETPAATPTPNPSGQQGGATNNGQTVSTTEISLLGAPTPVGINEPPNAEGALVGSGTNSLTKVLTESEELFAKPDQGNLDTWWNPMTWWSWLTGL